MMIVPQYINELSEWEFEQLCACHSPIAEAMLIQRTRVTDTLKFATTTAEENFFEYLGINSQNPYYIRRAYNSFTVYFHSLVDKDNFEGVVNQFSQK